MINNMIETKEQNAAKTESWYPESGDEGEGTKETMSLTSFSGSMYHSSHYLDAVKLRVHIVVAEMKMELIRLQGKVKQLEVNNGLDDASEDIHGSKTAEQQQPTDQNELFKDYIEQVMRLNTSQSRVVGILSDLTGLVDDSHLCGDAASPKANRIQIPGDEAAALREAKEATEKAREILACVHSLFETSQKESVEYRGQIDKLKRQFQTKSTIHQIELEAFRTKHAQQVMDLCRQLEAYKEQVESQHEEMLRMQERYHDLEALAVTPKQAHDVLQAVNRITEVSSVEEQMEVQNQVVEILQRMSQMYTKQVHDETELHAILEAAKRKEERSTEELIDLKLQEEILLEETRIPAGDWREALAAQRILCERQISDIMSREESRLLEMEVLELKLTELAFSAVEIEDLRADVEQNRDEHESKITKINTFAVVTESAIARLRQQVEDILEKQNQSIQNFKPANPPAQKWKALLDRKTSIDRLDQVEKKLMIRNEELCSVKEELSQSKATIQLLEHKLSIAAGTKV
ncbi:MAG: hypothetical protein SGBAC_004381 [Bacillariaceae sp.]